MLIGALPQGANSVNWNNRLILGGAFFIEGKIGRMGLISAGRWGRMAFIPIVSVANEFNVLHYAQQWDSARSEKGTCGENIRP